MSNLGCQSLTKRYETSLSFQFFFCLCIKTQQIKTVETRIEILKPPDLLLSKSEPNYVVLNLFYNLSSTKQHQNNTLTLYHIQKPFTTQYHPKILFKNPQIPRSTYLAKSGGKKFNFLLFCFTHKQRSNQYVSICHSIYLIIQILLCQ